MLLVIWHLVLPSGSGKERDTSINRQERRENYWQCFVLFVCLHWINSLQNTQQKHLGRGAFLLKAVQPAKLRCSHCCLVLRKAAIKSNPVSLLIKQQS